MLNADQALQKLIDGNKLYLESATYPGDISVETRLKTAQEGQNPYAIVIACSDSRVIPECIFSAGIGELFVIRVAGNVLDRHQLGSIEYAAHHLGTKLIVMLGHTRCGAIGAAIEGHREGHIGYIIDDITEAIGGEKDDQKACRLNVLHGVERIKNELTETCQLVEDQPLKVVGAIYHVESGKVEFIED